MDVRSAPILPAVHALHVAAVVERWGVSRDELLGPLGWTPDRLTAPDARLGIGDVERLVARAQALTGEPGLGFWIGMQMRISAHGWLGFAAMTSSSVREALELAVRFAPTRTPAIALRVAEDGAAASLVLEERVALGGARETILVALLVGIWQIGNAITGRELAGDADLAFPAPRWFERFRDRFPGAVRFDRPTNQLVFPAATLDVPLVLADPAALRLAREQCERELGALRTGDDFAGRVRGALVGAGGPFPTLEQVARTLHVSPRTLKRRLAERGTSFSELLDELRRDRALLLLRSSDVSLDAVAERLGYSDVANFTRAFRRWTGTTPGAFRRGGGDSR